MRAMSFLNVTLVAASVAVWAAGCGSDSSDPATTETGGSGGASTSTGGAGATGGTSPKGGSGGGATAGNGGTTSGGKGGSSGASAGSAGSAGAAAGSAGSAGAAAGNGGSAGAAAGNGGSSGAAAGSAGAAGATAGNGGSSGAAAGSAGSAGATAGNGGSAGAAAGSGGAAGSAGSTSGGFCGLEKAVDCSALAPTTAAGLCAAFAQAQCGYLARCNLEGDVPGCVALVKAGCESGNGPKGFAAGREVLDGAAMACCLAKFENGAACTDIFAAKLSVFNSDPSCLAALTGTVATGGACYQNDDCASALCDTKSCPGTCVARVSLNGDCSGGKACDEGLLCVTAGAAQTCVPPACEGATCGKSGVPCASGLVCSPMNVCVKPPKAGDACALATGPFCDIEATTCVVDSTLAGTCAPHVANGGACFASLNCENGHYCQGVALPALGKCAPVLAPGAACDPATQKDQAPCGLTLQCNLDGKCGPKPTSGACDKDHQCGGHMKCDTTMGTCQPDPSFCPAP